MASWYFKPHRGSLIDAMEDTVGALSFDGVLDKIVDWLKPVGGIHRENLFICGERLADGRCGINRMFRVMLVTAAPGCSDHLDKVCIGHIFCEDDYDIEKWDLYMKNSNKHVDNS